MGSTSTPLVPSNSVWSGSYGAFAASRLESEVPAVSPAQVVKESLDAAARDKRSIIPGRLVRFSMLTTRSIPNSLKLPVIKRINEPNG